MNLRTAFQALRFAATGVLNTAVGLAVVVSARELAGLSEYAANATGYAVGLALGFALNRTWTFRDRGQISAVAPRYLLAFALSYAANLAMLAVCIETAGLDQNLAQASALLTYSVTFFVLCRWLVFVRPAAE